MKKNEKAMHEELKFAGLFIAGIFIVLLNVIKQMEKDDKEYLAELNETNSDPLTLDDELNIAIKNEDYERAAVIRDELKKQSEVK